MISLEYKSSEVDADVWMKQDCNPNEEPYYKYILCYVDDLFCIGFKPKEYMDVLNMIYRLKEVFGPPDRYLGANAEKVQLKDGRFVCSANFVGYLNNAIENIDNSLGVYKTVLKNYG